MQEEDSMSSMDRLERKALMDWLIEQIGQSSDFKHQSLKMESIQGDLIYLKTIIDNKQLYDMIIRPFFELPTNDHFVAYINSLPNTKGVHSKDEALMEITNGSLILFIKSQVYLIDLKKVNTNQVMQAQMEPTIQGPALALTEDLDTNLNLIRNRYHQANLISEIKKVGKTTNVSLAVLYDDAVVDVHVLRQLKKKIEALDLNIVQSTSELMRFLNEKKRSIMPIMMLTERPDRIVSNLANGKIIIILDGSPTVIIAPTVFFDFLNSMEDNYHSYWVSKITKILRYLSLIVCLIFPGLYVALTAFNPDVFRAELALSIAGSRIGVPYPSFIEIIFMLFVMELLTEASIRLPKAISATATTVGGLILGTAATEAALTSNIMIIVVSAVAISTFVIPVNEMSFAIRAIRYMILFFSTIAGLTGLMLSLIGFVMYLTNLDSFGMPYLKLFAQNKKAETEGTQQ